MRLWLRSLRPLRVGSSRSTPFSSLSNADHVSFDFLQLSNLNDWLTPGLAHGRFQHGFCRLLIEVHALPHFNHQERPDFQRVVPTILCVVAEDLLHCVRTEH